MVEIKLIKGIKKHSVRILKNIDQPFLIVKGIFEKKNILQQDRAFWDEVSSE